MKQILIPALLLCCPLLCANEKDAVAQLWQDYVELGMLDKLLSELEEESRKGDASREQELTSVLLTYWDEIMQRRRWGCATIHWDGDGAYGSIRYRNQDLPLELQQQLHDYQIYRTNLTRTGKLNEEEEKLHFELFSKVKDCINSAPNAEKIDQIILHIHREEYPQATSRLAQLRQEHPDYCPQAFAELAAALATPNRLQLLLLCTRLPLGVIWETHIVE